ncbi:ROK family transcriptional regulator [Devosia sp. PTR5]|uniref:ROK family transcriptional regulator n=1 Tax=Devosia oryzisoli TaxID=2774138 RepID=A0A927IQ15_9HYPH|nr:ROK family transcriptional regulator [Devosia oryzisoli]MBD8065160.1 ROK family transcriptional regulator [Devosia oryzisoli]
MACDGIQRPALARKLGLSRQATSDLLAGLETRGLVEVSGSLKGVPGRSDLLYALRDRAAVGLGVDVGGTKVAAALLDLRGRVLAERAEPTDRGGPPRLIAQISALADTLCRDAGVPRFHLRQAVVGIPAAVDPQDGRLTLAGNLPGIEGLSFRDPLQASMGATVRLENDVNLALVAEMAHGTACNCGNVLFVGLGTGIGGALAVEGRLVRGAFGGGGELGYLPLWGLQAKGLAPLERRVGEAGIRDHYVSLGGETEHSVRDIFDAATAGHPAAAAALNEAARFVAQGVVSALALLDMEMVVFGGSIGARTEFIDRVRVHVETSWMRPVAVVRSSAGSRAGLLGAVETAHQSLLDELFGPLPAG